MSAASPLHEVVFSGTTEKDLISLSVVTDDPPPVTTVVLVMLRSKNTKYFTLLLSVVFKDAFRVTSMLVGPDGLTSICGIPFLRISSKTGDPAAFTLSLRSVAFPSAVNVFLSLALMTKPPYRITLPGSEVVLESGSCSLMFAFGVVVVSDGLNETNVLMTTGLIAAGDDGVLTVRGLLEVHPALVHAHTSNLYVTAGFGSVRQHSEAGIF